jgi:putative transposase
MVRAVWSARLSDFGRRLRLVTELCFDIGSSCCCLQYHVVQSASWLWLPKTPSELKMQRFRAIVRSWWYLDELSFRRPFRSGSLQFSNPCRPAGGDPRARHQLTILQKNAPPRLRLQRSDRLLWVVLSRWWPGWRSSLHIVRPDTVLAWHRRVFAWYWRRKSRRRPGRPNVAADIRDLIRDMSQANPLWGAPRIHGELLKLGIEVAQSTVAKYLRRPRKPPSQTWRSFLTNHLEQIASIDFFVVPTATFRILFVFVVLSHARRRVLHFQVTEHPSQEWTMQQIREAFPWEHECRYLLRDRDAIYGGDLVAMTKVRGWRRCLPHRDPHGKIRTWSG